MENFIFCTVFKIYDILNFSDLFNVSYWLVKNCKLRLYNKTICTENRLLKVLFCHFFIIDFIIINLT